MSTSRLSPELISPEAVEALRLALEQAHMLPAGPEPDWKAMEQSYARSPAKLPKEAAQELVLALRRLYLLPFHRFEACLPLFEFFFVELPKIEAAMRGRKDAGGLELAGAFGILAEMMLQGLVMAPVEVSPLAERFVAALRSSAPAARKILLPMARMLRAKDTRDGVCGFNRSRVEDPDTLALFEHRLYRGEFEKVLKRSNKIESYRRKLLKSEAFRAEWTALKGAFRGVPFLDKKGVARRTVMPERNWRRGPPPKLDTPREAFQVAFDLFCWKWFLHGMRGDEPLVQKPYYAFTPWGTQLLIPGYMSFDPHRDLDWKEFNRLHKARGVEPQGEKLETSRADYDRLIRKVGDAERMAKALGLHGSKRMDYLRQAAGLGEQTDERQIRRLLSRCH